MKRIFHLLAGLAAVLLLLGGCSGKSNGTSTRDTGGGGDSSTGTAPLSPSLKAKLLSVTDLPSGWSIDNSADTSGGSAPPCLRTITNHKYAGETGKAKVDFKQGTNVPSLSETVVSFEPDGAHAAFDKAVSALASCKDFTIESDGTKFTGSIGEMSFAAVGDESRAFSISLSAKGFNFSGAFIVFRKGGVTGDIAYIDLGSVDTTELKGYVDKALAKLS